MDDRFAWTIPLIQFGFGVLFLVVRRAGAAREARDWGLGFLLSATSFAASLIAPLTNSLWIIATADLGFALAFHWFGSALLRRYGSRQWLRVRLPLLGMAIAAPLYAVVVAGDLHAELLGSDLGCAAQIILPLLLIAWPPGWIDRAIIALSWLVAATNLCRNVAAPVGGGAALSTFSQTAYSFVMYIDGMVTGCAFAILALIAVTGELLADSRRDAMVDPLTGLLNRRGFDHAIARQSVDRAGGIVSCDLDHFKRVNDQCGHDVGDRVLAAFSDLIRTVLPANAIAARVGGEEFLLYLPGATLRQTEELALMLQRLMRRHDWQAAGLGWQQSASFGVAVQRGGALRFAEAVKAADEQLYEAKRHGRDQVKTLLAA